MQIVEFTPGTLRFVDDLPAQPPPNGFVWVFLEREQFEQHLPQLQCVAHDLGGSTMLELHVQDLVNAAHPSHYDYTSIYDLIVFRRLATVDETAMDSAAAKQPEAGAANDSARYKGLDAGLQHVGTRAVAFVVFDRLLISVHPGGCDTARSFIARYLADAVHSDGLSAAARSRLPTGAADLMLRMLNEMVDSYLELRKQLSSQLDHWQHQMLRPSARPADWGGLMAARSELHTLEDLCEEQQDAMQEWLDTLRGQSPNGALAQGEHDALVARSRDIIEHIQRVVNHVQRMEQGAETAVQIHFSAQSNRTNDIMRVLTTLTAVFLPLNLIAGIFGMNFDSIPLLHKQGGFWWAMGGMVAIAAGLVLWFWRKKYLAQPER